MVEIEILRDETDEPFVVASIRSPADTLKVLAEVSFQDDCLVLDGLHVHAPGLGGQRVRAGTATEADTGGRR